MCCLPTMYVLTAHECYRHSLIYPLEMPMTEVILLPDFVDEQTETWC